MEPQILRIKAPRGFDRAVRRGSLCIGRVHARLHTVPSIQAMPGRADGIREASADRELQVRAVWSPSCQQGGGLDRKGATFHVEFTALELKSFTARAGNWVQIATTGYRKGCGQIEHLHGFDRDWRKASARRSTGSAADSARPADSVYWRHAAVLFVGHSQQSA